jgi:hypothetical protein
MANGDTNNIHPGRTGLSSILAFFTGNPIFSLLSFLLFLGIVLPPRKRKRSYGNHRRVTPVKRRRSGSRSRVKKAKKVKKTKRSKTTVPAASTPRKKTKKSRSAGRVMPERFKNAKAGTPLMKEKMLWMRSKR